MTDTTVHDARLIAELEDLLQLDHDAVAAYDVALRSLKSDAYRDTVRAFRGDHERHITELTRLLHDRGGVAIQLPHLPTGIFKLAVQQAGRLGYGDVGVLLAFKANERQVRDKYRRMAERVSEPEISVVLGRAAADEARHYAWALEMLDDLGAGSRSRVGRIERAVEVAHARMGDTVEAAERGVMMAAEGARQAVKRTDRPWLLAAAAMGAGLLAASLFRRD